MANTKFTAAVKRAKKLYRTGRYNSFADAVKAAYKKGSTKPAKRSKTRQAKPRKTKRRRVNGTLPIVSGMSAVGMSVSKLKAELRARLKDTLGKQLVRRELATKARSKKKVSKSIIKTRRELKKLA